MVNQERGRLTSYETLMWKRNISITYLYLGESDGTVPMKQ